MTTSRSGRITLVSRRVFEVVRNILRFDADIYCRKGEICVSFFRSRFCLNLFVSFTPHKKCISCRHFMSSKSFLFPAFEPLAKVLTDPDSALNKHLGPHDSIQFDSDDSVRYRIQWDVCIYIYVRIYTYIYIYCTC